MKNSKSVDVAALVSQLKKDHSIAIDGGYGKLKGQTFRISNMGDETDASMQVVINALDDVASVLGF